MKVNYNNTKLKVFLILSFLLFVNNLLLAQNSSVDIPGCRNPLAINYNPNATVDDESCEFPKAKGLRHPGISIDSSCANKLLIDSKK